MRSSPVLLLSALAVTNAFAPNTNLSVRNMNVNHVSGLHMTVKVPITLTGDNIDLTPALTDYANQKLDRTLGKLSTMSGVTHCDVYLTVNKNPKVRDMYDVYIIMITSRHCASAANPFSHNATIVLIPHIYEANATIICFHLYQVENGHTAEVVTTLKGTTFRVAEASPDMYASIDSVADRLVSIQYF